ncbi:MAG: radical SAM family heme chaperone HemW, partial [Chloroflexota bacterium]
MTLEPPRQVGVVPAAGIGLYIHVPFCKTKCPYCDFNTYQGIEGLMGPYLEALTTELRLWGLVLAHPGVNTVFFGGGTPSYLPDGHLRQMLEAARLAFQFQADAEITVEANPDDLDLAACRRLLDLGVNRLSIGVQSLDNDLLAQLGRRHDAAQAIAACRIAQKAGFRNINLDLMYGLPHQTMPQWEDTVQRLVALQPSHISLYCLTLEEGTPLHRWVRQGKLPEPDPDLAADMYHYAEGVLEGSGYHHYEISNWSLPGFAAQHNLTYWLNRPYLGVGPGAHSSLGHCRFWVVDSPRDYISRVKQWAGTDPQPIAALTEAELGGIPPVEGQEYISPELACAETMFLGLRLLDGIDLAAASSQVGRDLGELYQPQIDELLQLGLLEWQEGRLRLTKP